jgi:hypothetical protein
MKRLVVTLVAIVVLAGAVVGGVVLDRTVLDDNQGITDAEHDRLVDACTTQARAMETENPATICLAWIARISERADERGVGYAELADELDGWFDAEAECTARYDNQFNYERCLDKYTEEHPLTD